MNSVTTKQLYGKAIRAACLGVFVNLALGVIKLVGGLLANSFALISDAINSMGDAVTSVVVVAALFIAQRPADDEHPYGHTRAEAIAATNVALLIMLSALYIGWEAIQRLFSWHEIPPLWTLAIAGGNVILKEGLYWYKMRVAKETGSAALVANAWDHRSDALCSLAVLTGLALVRWGGEDFLWADEVAALVVVLAILWSSLELFRNSASELMDVQANEELVKEIRGIAEAVPAVCAVEKLWVRKTGLEYLVDIHIEVDQNLTVAEGHAIGHRVKDALVERIAPIRDVLVHLEPYPHTDYVENSSA